MGSIGHMRAGILAVATLSSCGGGGSSSARGDVAEPSPPLDSERPPAHHRRDRDGKADDEPRDIPGLPDRTPPPNQDYDRGAELYQRKQFSKAASAFERAFAVDHNTAFGFAWAQALRQSGDCLQAMVLYHRLLHSPLKGPNAARKRRMFKRGLEECEKSASPETLEQLEALLDRY